MIQIKPITENEYQNLVDWNNGKDEDYLFQWAGHKAYQYPISIEQIKARIQEGARIFIIFWNGNAVGSVELDRIDTENPSANVCRFILCDEAKNKGIGTLALKQLSILTFNEMKLDVLTLGVFCYNIGAIRCYEKCGFLVKEYHQRDDAKWNSYTMELAKNREANP